MLTGLLIANILMKTGTWSIFTSTNISIFSYKVFTGPDSQKNEFFAHR